MRKLTYHFVLWIDGKPAELHTWKAAYGDKDWYTSITSMNAFGHRESKRLAKAWEKKLPTSSLHKRCHVDYAYESMLASDIGKLQDAKLKKFEHATLWDLYKAVGYDYKKQRYVE